MECDHQNHRYKPDNTQTLAKPLLQITYNPDIAAGVVCLHICMLKLYVTICLRLSSKRYRQTTIKIDCLYFICMINCFYSISESCRFRSSEFVWIVDSETYALDTAVDDWCHYYRVIEHKTYPFYQFCFQWHQPISALHFLSASPQYELCNWSMKEEILRDAL